MMCLTLNTKARAELIIDVLKSDSPENLQSLYAKSFFPSHTYAKFEKLVEAERNKILPS